MRLDRARAHLLHALLMHFGRSLSFEAALFDLAFAFDAALGFRACPLDALLPVTRPTQPALPRW